MTDSANNRATPQKMGYFPNISSPISTAAADNRFCCGIKKQGLRLEHLPQRVANRTLFRISLDQIRYLFLLPSFFFFSSPAISDLRRNRKSMFSIEWEMHSHHWWAGKREKKEKKREEKKRRENFFKKKKTPLRREYRPLKEKRKEELLGKSERRKQTFQRRASKRRRKRRRSEEDFTLVTPRCERYVFFFFQRKRRWKKERKKDGAVPKQCLLQLW